MKMEITLPISSIVIIALGSVGVATAVLMSIVFLIQKKELHISDIFLCALLLLSGLTLLNDTLTTSGISNRFQNLYYIPIFYSLSIAPLFYIFIKSKYSGRHRGADFLHLLLPAIQAVVYFSIGFQSIAYKSRLWENEVFRQYLTVESFLFPTGMILYSILSRSILNKRSGRDYFWSDDLRNWLLHFTNVFIFIAILEFTISIAEYFFAYRFGAAIYIARLLIFTVFIFWITYNAIRLLFSSSIYTSKPVESEPALPADEFSQLTAKLTKLMEEDKVYLNSDLSLQILANYAGTTEKKCSHALSKGLDTNFNQFINSYRVEELKERLREGRHKELTLLSIAYDCGFESKSTFNRSFKSMTGVTPSQFIKSLPDPA